MKFRARLELAGKTATGFTVPAKIVESLGSGKRPAVRVTIKGYTYRSSVATIGGRFMIGVNAENRESAGVAAGDELEVEIELDSQPREVILPPDFKKALAREPAAMRFFDGLSYSQMRWFVMGIEDAKTAETRQRRIDKAVDRLRQGRGQL
ncbi:MAG TPA: YdeI/OmpD-associated family protein [Candidatus Dormibacteraeota bacterium]|nr:YdeI/OmpD-associated family protein [Candidatus Dormibacteraeota bacterium]